MAKNHQFMDVRSLPQYDKDWIILILEAKQSGFSKAEIRNIIKKLQSE